MSKLSAGLASLARDSSGATAIEYGLIAGGIFLAIAPAVAIIGGQMGATYQEIMGYF